MALQNYLSKIICLSLILLTAAAFLSPEAFAWGRPRVVRHVGHHPHYGKYVTLPPKVVRVVASGVSYYYYEGHFYQKVKNRYLIVAPPRGAVIRTLPAGYKKIIIEKRPYYYYNDVYYVEQSQGYEVVENPVYQAAAIPEEVKVLNPVQTKTVERPYTVQVPNANGSYTQVVIREVEDGFVGPEGEFYPEAPRLDQLEEMYGK